MVNDNTPSPKRARKRKKVRVTKRKIYNMKVMVRAQRRLLKDMPPKVRVVVLAGIRQLESWIKAYGG